MSDFNEDTSVKEIAWYLYGIVNSVDHVESVCPELIGITGEPSVSVIYSNNCGGVISAVPLDQFGEEALEQNLQNINWLEEKVRLHQQLLQQVMAKQTVIPMKFGVIFRSKEKVKVILEEGREQFGNLLDKLSGYSEWGVKGYYRQQQLFHYLTNKEKSQNQGQPSSGGGMAYLIRKKFEEKLEELALDYSQQIGAKVFNHLKTICSDAVLNKLLSRKATGREEELFFNGAFLLAGDAHEEFQQIVQIHNNEIETQGLFLEVSGPWPAYSFVG